MKSQILPLRPSTDKLHAPGAYWRIYSAAVCKSFKNAPGRGAQARGEPDPLTAVRTLIAIAVPSISSSPPSLRHHPLQPSSVLSPPRPDVLNYSRVQRVGGGSIYFIKKTFVIFCFITLLYTLYFTLFLESRRRVCPLPLPQTPPRQTTLCCACAWRGCNERV